MIKQGQIDLTTATELVKNKTFSSLNCHNIGRIVEFFPDTQTANIEIMQIKNYYNNLYNLPLLLNIPVIIYGTMSNGITLGDLTGSTCLLLFLDRDISSFLETGEVYTPESDRMHDFSDCVAITTFKNNVDKISNYENEAINIYNTKEDIEENSTSNSFLKVFGDNVNGYSTKTTQAEGEESVTASSNLSVNPLSVLLENSAGGQVEVNAKINIANTNQNLATLMQNFLTACKSITVDTNTGVLTPTSQQAFEDLITSFGELLQ